MNSSSHLVNPAAGNVLGVSELVRQARRALESTLPLGWVAGEVSGLTRAASGHMYFSLKDEGAQLRCTMWRGKAQLLPFQLLDGMRVEVRAQLTVYEARGDMQLAVENVRAAGLGSRFEALMRLKARLEAEGLFDPARRRAFPSLPRRIGIVTSPAGAALHDVLVTLKRRAPAMQVVIYPTLVQGDGAGARVAQAIQLASARVHEDRIEALIVCRGGGSLEDLWAFNDEGVVRAVRACAVPVVSGVGHETDTTLCDFAADLRVATPTAAAEVLSGDHYALSDRLEILRQHLYFQTERRLRRAQQRLDLVERSLRHPRERLDLARSSMQHLALRLRRGLERAEQRTRLRLERAGDRLTRARPDAARLRHRLDSQEERLRRLPHIQLERARLRADALAHRLAALNPSAVLQRGYAVVRNAQGNIVRSANELKPGDEVRLTLGEGDASANITRVADSDA